MRTVAVIAAILLSAMHGLAGSQQDAAANERFRLALNQMGGSVAKPLVERLDRLADADIPEGRRDLRLFIQRKLTGRIGPLNGKAQSKRVDFAVPPDFRQGCETLLSLARAGHVGACTEIGAVVFTDALEGLMGMSPRNGADYLRKAAGAGDENARYLYAFCLYYGIGLSVGKSAAYAQLKARADARAAAAKKIRPPDPARSWEARRLSELKP